MLEKGLIQIYTGDGKGKTTAALGLAVRMAGHGCKALIYQFLKPPSLQLGERSALQALSEKITFEALDSPWDLNRSLSDPQAREQTKKAIHRACIRLAETAEKKQYDLIVLDEIVFCLDKALAKIQDIRHIISKRDSRVEIVLTGRGSIEELIELADLVSEIKNVKHPYQKDITARAGIEY